MKKDNNNVYNNPQSLSTNDIAIIGMSARLPMAEDIECFWENLRNGTDCIRKLSGKRKEHLEKYLKLKGMDMSAVSFNEAAFLERIDEFDYEFFDISKREATLMDPNQRIFLETVWETIEDAGYSFSKIKGSQVGIYVGFIGESRYIDIIKDIEPASLSMATTGNISSIIAGRISFLLDLKGPNMIINTSCSSSLVALHLACKSILNGECDLAIAGGVQIHSIPIRNTIIGIESCDNRSKTFDESANGTGTGEGAGSVLLKPLHKAIDDNDHIYAIIKGSAVNQDGRSIGISAPNPIAQEDVIIKAWIDADIRPCEVSYIEAHGTGTKLGDPIEVDGITRAFAKYTEKKQFCAISSVKSNIGHLDSAAGIAGLIKSVLQVYYGEIVPTVHFKKYNSSIDFKNSPVYVNSNLQKWKTTCNTRICGVSSFGISGTNCHVVLQETPVKESCYSKPSDKLKMNILTLSAKTENALRRLISKYIDFLMSNNDDSIEDICYTSNLGREHYMMRLAIIAECKCELIKKLELSTLNDNNQMDIYHGIYKKINNYNSRINGYSDDNNHLKQIAIDYVNGSNFNWEELYKGENRRKVRLPLYSFEKTSCWINFYKTEFDSIPYSNQSLPNNEMVSDNELFNLKNRIKEIFTNVLDCKAIDNNSDFFTLGGDSILALDIINSVNNEFKIETNVTELLKNSTINKFSEIVNAKILNENIYKIYHNIPIAEKREYYNITSSQKRMYVLSQLDDSNTHYNISSAFMITGDLNIERLELAFVQLIKRHEILRTSFHYINGDIMQKVHCDVNFKLNIYEDNNHDVNQMIQRCIRPFKLSEKSLFRVFLIIKESSYLLISDMHHIISDGTTSNILMNELAQLYENKILPEQRLQYKDFADWQTNKFLKIEYLKKQEKFWLNKFEDGIESGVIPTDFPRSAQRSFEGATLYFNINQELKSKLQKMSTNMGVTMFIFLLTVYKTLIYKYSGISSIIVGIGVSGRLHKDLENVAGMFVNTLALKNRLDSNDTFYQSLKRINETTLECYRNQEYPFEMLVEKLNLNTVVNRNPLFDTMFLMQSNKNNKVQIGGLTLKYVDREVLNSKFDILLNCYEGQNELKFEINYCKKLYKAKTIERLWENYISILNYVLNNPDVKICDINLT